MLNYLESFLSLSRTLSFSKTASDLHVSQPCISRQIRLLEEEMGCQLFLRNNHKVLLTPKGEELKNQLGPLFGELQKIFKNKQKPSKEIKGELAIGSISEVGQSYIFQKALEFSERFEKMSLRMEYLRQPEIIEKIKLGVLTFGIVPQLPREENIHAYKLMKECIVLAKRKSVRLTATPEFVVHKPNDPGCRLFFKKFKKKFGFSSYQEKIVVNSHRSMIDALLKGNYCAVVPYHTISSYVEKGILTYEEGTCIEGNLYLIHYHNPLMEERDKAFKSFIIDEAKKCPYIEQE